jgi:hypothetical protein
VRRARHQEGDEADRRRQNGMKANTVVFRRHRFGQLIFNRDRRPC